MVVRAVDIVSDENLLEEMESIQAYDDAMASGDEVIPFEQAIEEIRRGPDCVQSVALDR